MSDAWGLSLKCKQCARSSWADFLLSALLCAALLMAFEDMLRLENGLIPLALGVGVIGVLSARPMRGEWPAALTLCLSVALAMLIPQAREGARVLTERLFHASQAVNHYAYAPVDVHVTGAEALRAENVMRMLLAASAGAICILAVRRRAVSLVLALCVAAFEIYFGLAPDTWFQIALFTLLAACCGMGSGWSWRRMAEALSFALLTALMAVWLLPGVHQPLEDFSERLRDLLSPMLSEESVAPLEADESVNRVRQESLLNEQMTGEDADSSQPYRDYRKQAVYRRYISAPKVWDMLKMVLMGFMIVALFVAPFVPFYIYDRARRAALSRRAVFDDPDCAKAVRAMFTCVIQCLTAIGLTDDNDDFSALTDKVSALLSQDDAHAYESAVALWQRATYSDHPLTEGERQSLREFLSRIERLTWERVSRKDRLRLKLLGLMADNEKTSTDLPALVRKK